MVLALTRDQGSTKTTDTAEAMHDTHKNGMSAQYMPYIGVTMHPKNARTKRTLRRNGMKHTRIEEEDDDDEDEEN